MRRVVGAALAVALFVGVVALWGGSGERVARDAPASLTVNAAEARAVVAEFITHLNTADVATAFSLVADSVRAHPEAIDGVEINPMLDFAGEFEYAVWTAALGGWRDVDSCSIKRWVRRVDGVPRPEDAVLLTCCGSFTTQFFAAIGLEPMPLAMTVAIDDRHEIVLFKEVIVDAANTAAHLDFRRWLRARHPDDELVVFTPGGTPRATLESAALMMEHAAAYAAEREVASGS